MTVKDVHKVTVNNLIQKLRGNGGCLPEACDSVNNGSRRLVDAMRDEYGEAWLGKVNLYGDERNGEFIPMWKWDGSLVHNFEACFVAPCYDQTLVDLILRRDQAEYTGTKRDLELLEPIFERLQYIGGYNLHWS